jgi:hypothetical protein
MLFVIYLYIPRSLSLEALLSPDSFLPKEKGENEAIHFLFPLLRERVIPMESGEE